MRGFPHGFPRPPPLLLVIMVAAALLAAAGAATSGLVRTSTGSRLVPVDAPQLLCQARFKR